MSQIQPDSCAVATVQEWRSAHRVARRGLEPPAPCTQNKTDRHEVYGTPRARPIRLRAKAGAVNEQIGLHLSVRSSPYRADRTVLGQVDRIHGVEHVSYTGRNGLLAQQRHQFEGV